MLFLTTNQQCHSTEVGTMTTDVIKSYTKHNQRGKSVMEQVKRESRESDNMAVKMEIGNTHTTVLWPFVSEPPGWDGARINLLLDFYGAREDNRGRHINHPARCHSSWTNQRPTSSITPPPIFTPDALPAATLPLYPGLEQAPNMLVWLPSGVVT